MVALRWILRIEIILIEDEKVAVVLGVIEHEMYLLKIGKRPGHLPDAAR